jgi:hypothetical protein
LKYHSMFGLIIVAIILSTAFASAQCWNIVEVDTSSTSKSNALIHSDDLGALHIFYLQGSHLTHAHGSNSFWTYSTTRFTRPFTEFLIDNSFTTHGISRSSNRDAILYFSFSESDSIQDTVASSNGTYVGPNIALEFNGSPVVSYFRSDFDSLYVASLIGTVWNIQPVIHTSGYGAETITKYRDQILYIAYSYSGPPGAMNLATRQNNLWQNEIIDQGGIYGTFGYDVDDSGNSCFAYGKDYLEYQYPLNVIIETDNGWEQSVLDTSGTIMGSAIGLKIDSLNIINIVYAIFSYTNNQSYLKYAYRVDNTWYAEVIDSVSIGYSGAIEISPDGLINTCYIKGSGSQAKLVYSFRQRPTKVIDNGPMLPPAQFSFSAYPNPFNSAATITLTGAEQAEIGIYDITGRLITTLHATQGRAVWDASGVSSGVYFARVVGEKEGAIKLVLVK